MANRRSIALAATVSMFCLLPLAAHAGSGGTPTAPGAGKSTDYCCTTLERGDTRRRGNEERGSGGNQGSAASFLNGTGCVAIDEDSLSRNACQGTVVKCRGELFTPNPGKVDRCLTP
jgi:hypothetical protein